MSREIVLDTETTGLDPLKGHKIIEIGAVELLDHIPTGETFHTYINPDRDIPEDSIRIHKITQDKINDKPFFSDVADEFLTFIGDSLLIIHNAEFDLKFLNFELNESKKEKLNNAVVDTLFLAREKYPGSAVSLDSLCKKFNIDDTTRKEEGHGALLDSILLSKVYLELLGGKQPNFGFEKEFEEPQENQRVKRTENLERLKTLNVRLSETDIKIHEKFLFEIGCEKSWQTIYKKIK